MPGPNVDMFIVIISSPRGARRWSADTSGLRARDNQPGPAYKIIHYTVPAPATPPAFA